jgi:hypothetical protein
VIVFVYRAVERGGDLGGSTLGFLGPAFLCTLLLGATKLMTFFGQGAMLTASAARLWAPVGCGIVAGMLIFGWAVTLPLYRRHKRLLLQQPRSSTPEHAVES